MANIVVTSTPVDVNVSTTLSNVVVTDLDSNNTVNVTTTLSNVSVTSTPVNVTISQSVGVSNAEIRAAISATTPITYDNNTGIIGFDPSSNNMQVLSLTTTNDVTSGGAVSASGNVSGNGLVITNNATVGGTLNVANITIGGDLSANLKDISLSYYDAGNVSGNVTLDVANGPVQKIRLTNNLTGLTFTGATAAQPITLIIQQDNVGFWTLDTTTHASNWTNWLFTSNFKTLSTTANAYDYLSVTYDGVNYYASLVNFFQTLITNAELANSNVVVNGTTISLGSSGNISHFGALTTTNLPEGTRLYFTAARVRGNVSAATPLTYNSATGQFGFADFAQIGGLNVNSTQAYAGVSLRVNKYTGGGNPNAMDVIGNATISEKLTVTGNVQGNFFIGNGAFLTGVTSLTNAQVLSYIATQPLTVGGNLTVNGNINATGNINVQNVTDLYVRDQIIVLNANAVTNANVQLISNRPTATSTSLKWNEQSTRWEFTNNGTTYYPIPTSTTDLAEGTNLYYTTDRANTAIGAYQGDINTAGNITGSIVTATTINTTDLTATNNVFALGALHSPDGSNIQYVRAWNVNYESTNTASSLNVLLESENNNRIAYASGGNLRYVPATKTLFLTDGTIGSNDNNLQGNNLIIGNVTASSNITATGNIQGAFIKGNGSQLTGLTTTQVTEGTNLYYTDARVDTHLNTATATTNQVLSWSGTDYDWIDVSGTGTVTQIDTGENLTGGPITTTGTIGMANSLANVNSVSTESGQNLTLTSDTKVTFNERINGGTSTVANIDGLGYSIYNASLFGSSPRISYSGSGNITQFAINGATTAGSNTITGVTQILEAAPPGNFRTINDLLVGTFLYNAGLLSTYPFPRGARIVSIDAVNNSIIMSHDATATATITLGTVVFRAGIHDSNTGLTIAFLSQYDTTGSGSRSTIVNTTPIPTEPIYGYPSTGFTIDDFDVYTYDNSASYSIVGDISSFFNGKTKIEAPKTVMNFPRGLTVGDADLTNRAEGDSFPSFGVNVLWDGLANIAADYANNAPITQLLVKQYSDNSVANGSMFNSGPRIFFTAAQGNKNQSFADTYLRTNAELGRITWWCPTSGSAAPSTLAPPAYINAVANRDMTGTQNGGVGMYLSVSPNNNAARRGLFVGHQLGTTLIASSNTTTTGASQPIVFAPMYTNTTPTTAGNAVFMFDSTLSATNYQWANINYDNATGKTGSRLSITNGASTVAGRNGNLVLALDRNDNGAGFGDKEWAFKLQPASNNLVLTEDDTVRVTVSGGTVTATAFVGDGSDLTDVRAKTVEEKVINKSGGTLPKGTPVYATGDVTADALWVGACDAGNAATMPCIGVLATELANDTEGRAIVVGTISGVDTSAFVAGDRIYVAVGGGYANVSPAGESNTVQFLGTVTRVDASQGGGVVNIDSPRNTDALNSGNIFVGGGDNRATTAPLGTAITDANVKLKQFAETVVSLGNVTGDQSSNINLANGSIFTMTATGNLTISSLTNAVAGSSATLIITQDATGNRTLTSTMKFAGASKTLSTAANSIDIISVFYDGTTYYATLSKGYA